jgi:predicted adenine nucleotide alpha hydrolase (AANH) superfamily ATPase
MCKQHLLGEHVELHMFIGTLKRKISVWGYLDNGLFEPRSIYTRHEVLVKEMLARGGRHQSPLEVIDLPFSEEVWGTTVNTIENLEELCERCDACRARIHAVWSHAADLGVAIDERLDPLVLGRAPLPSPIQGSPYR